MIRAAARLLVQIAFEAVVATGAFAQDAAAPRFEVPQAGLTFITGDTWIQNGQTIRPYGVQSCIRGTTFTNQAGAKADCGEASLSYLAALVQDTKPQCAPVAQIGHPPTILVVCSAHVGSATLDLGTILITEGFAFAAFNNDARPVYMPYLVAERLAKHNKAGLWAAPDLPHPNPILFGAVKARK
jgi:endonuclease YncB( thermonuclease family)